MVLGEFGATSDTHYLLGLDIIGQQTNSGWDYFGYDGLGSTRFTTNGAGNVTSSAWYDPYDTPYRQGATFSLGFTGEMTDGNGLQYLRARYLDPSTAAFLTKDPVIGVAGLSASYNPYIYVRGNPR